MNMEAVLGELQSWSRTFRETVPTPVELEAAFRGEVDAETKRLMVSYAGDGLWNRREVGRMRAGINELQT